MTEREQQSQQQAEADEEEVPVYSEERPAAGGESPPAAELREDRVAMSEHGGSGGEINNIGWDTSVHG